MSKEQDWFTVEKLTEDTIAISEYKHWEENHCYLLLGAKKALLIDTGLGVANIRKVVDQLTDLPVFVVTTHVHWDHIGGHHYFDEIGVYETEKAWLSEQFPVPLPVVLKNLERDPCDFPVGFDSKKYQIFQGEPTKILRDHEQIDLGGRMIEVIHTPGHSPGHVVFYEMARKVLYSGDLIYCGTLDAFYPTTDPRAFYQSIKKMDQLAIKKILPGHHSLEVPVTIIRQIRDAMEELDCQGRLKQGSGMFDYDGFSLHL